MSHKLSPEWPSSEAWQPNFLGHGEEIEICKSLGLIFHVSLRASVFAKFHKESSPLQSHFALARLFGCRLDGGCCLHDSAFFSVCIDGLARGCSQVQAGVLVRFAVIKHQLKTAWSIVSQCMAHH